MDLFLCANDGTVSPSFSLGLALCNSVVGSNHTRELEMALGDDMNLGCFSHHNINK